MKILMVTDYYPPVSGGISRYVYTLSNSLCRNGHDVTVFTIGTTCKQDRLVENGVDVIRSDGLFQKIPLLYKSPQYKHHPPLADPIIVKKLKKIIYEKKPDVIHSHGWIINSVLPMKKYFKIPLVHSLHEYGLMCPKKTFLKTYSMCNRPYTLECINCSSYELGLIKASFSYIGIKQLSSILNKVDKLISVSSFVNHAHIKHIYLNKHKYVIIHNFYHPEPYKEIPNVFPDEYILYVGILSPHKGLDILLNAYKQIETNVKLVILGNSLYPHNYAGSNNIFIIKNPSRDLILQGYSKCSFLVVPSLSYETFGMINLEAMSFKKAIVASKIGGIPEVVKDKVNGLLVEPGNINSLKNAIEILLKNPELTKKFGENGYDRFLSHFSENKITHLIEKVYMEVI